MVLRPYDRARAADGGCRAASGVRPADADAAARIAEALAPVGDELGRPAGIAPCLAGPDRSAAGLDRAHLGIVGLACAGAVRGGAASPLGTRLPTPQLPRRRSALLVIAGREPARQLGLRHRGVLAVRDLAAMRPARCAAD